MEIQFDLTTLHWKSKFKGMLSISLQLQALESPVKNVEINMTYG